ncbi:MAG: hypothetical protein IH612_12830 [Desulfofustis sp.]|nr:hypothetical protein [Desulfofustis sp.]
MIMLVMLAGGLFSAQARLSAAGSVGPERKEAMKMLEYRSAAAIIRSGSVLVIVAEQLSTSGRNPLM